MDNERKAILLRAIQGAEYLAKTWRQEFIDAAENRKTAEPFENRRSEAQRRRWAKPATKAKSGRHWSVAARKRQAEAMRKRWAAKKAATSETAAPSQQVMGEVA